MEALLLQRGSEISPDCHASFSMRFTSWKVLSEQSQPCHPSPTAVLLPCSPRCPTQGDQEKVAWSRPRRGLAPRGMGPGCPGHDAQMPLHSSSLGGWREGAGPSSSPKPGALSPSPSPSTPGPVTTHFLDFLTTHHSALCVSLHSVKPILPEKHIWI